MSCFQKKFPERSLMQALIVQLTSIYVGLLFSCITTENGLFCIFSLLDDHTLTQFLLPVHTLQLGDVLEADFERDVGDGLFPPLTLPHQQ